MKRYGKLFAVMGVAVLSGCATTADLDDDTIRSRTALAIGMSPAQFTISGRTEHGGRVDYTVDASDGRTFSCYLTAGGVAFVAGVVASDAVCSEVGSGGKVTQCNALLKAAGKC